MDTERLSLMAVLQALESCGALLLQREIPEEVNAQVAKVSSSCFDEPPD